MKKSKDLIKPFRIEHGKHFRLKDHDPGHTAGVRSKAEAEKLLKEGVEKLADLQDKLYAQDSWALLLIFQAMDAAGKDGAIKHVMSGVNPQGCQVYSFKAPSPEELDHDYLWRTHEDACRSAGASASSTGRTTRKCWWCACTPRCWPPSTFRPLVTKDIWKERFEDIDAFERYLTRNGVVIRKFFLNVSKKEQKRRFLARLDEPEKNWKFSAADVHERACWDEYMDAYRGHDPPYRHARSALARDSRRQQMVHPAWRLAAAIIDTLED